LIIWQGMVIQDDSRREYRLYGREKNFLWKFFIYLFFLFLGSSVIETDCYASCPGSFLSRQSNSHDHAQGGANQRWPWQCFKKEGEYISDDDPLFNRGGCILPFPRPLGSLIIGSSKLFPKSMVYQIDRMNSELNISSRMTIGKWIRDKTLNDIFLLRGRRILSGTPSIEKCSKKEVLSTLIRDAVVGIGLYQVWNSSLIVRSGKFYLNDDVLQKVLSGA